MITYNKNAFGYILGDIFTNSSGHTGQPPDMASSNGRTFETKDPCFLNPGFDFASWIRNT
jgi:hypothetical protein